MYKTFVKAFMIFVRVIAGSASCDGNTLSYNCSYCPHHDTTTRGSGCNGNCKLNQSTGRCEKRGRKHYILYTPTRNQSISPPWLSLIIMKTCTFQMILSKGSTAFAFHQTDTNPMRKPRTFLILLNWPAQTMQNVLGSTTTSATEKDLFNCVNLATYPKIHRRHLAFIKKENIRVNFIYFFTTVMI